MSRLKRTIDLTGLVAATLLVSGIIWWSADTNARLRTVETAVTPIPQMVTDIALIRQAVTSKTTVVSEK